MSRPHRRVLRVIAPVAGLLAAGLLVWQGSYAAFDATSSNQGDAWASGSLVLKNNGTGGATFASITSSPLFNEAALKPGSTGTKCLTVESSGTSPGNIKFWVGSITGSTALGAQLQLTIDAAPLASSSTTVAPDCSTTGTNVVAFPTTGLTNLATGVALTALPTAYGAQTGLGVAPGTQHIAYRFSWTFVTTGSTAGDNALQSTSVQTPFNYEEQ